MKKIQGISTEKHEYFFKILRNFEIPSFKKQRIAKILEKINKNDKRFWIFIDILMQKE